MDGQGRNTNTLIPAHASTSRPPANTRRLQFGRPASAAPPKADKTDEHASPFGQRCVNCRGECRKTVKSQTAAVDPHPLPARCQLPAVSALAIQVSAGGRLAPPALLAAASAGPVVLKHQSGTSLPVWSARQPRREGITPWCTVWLVVWEQALHEHGASSSDFARLGMASFQFHDPVPASFARERLRLVNKAAAGVLPASRPPIPQRRHHRRDRHLFPARNRNRPALTAAFRAITSTTASMAITAPLSVHIHVFSSLPY